MALAIKKLLPGGTVDNTALNAELDKELGSFQLKSKDERKVREALGQFRDYFSLPDGKSFSVDPVTQKYTITGANNEAFEGSPDEIHRGWLSGNLKIKDDKDAMSVAAAIYNKALTNIKGTVPSGTISQELPKVSIRNIRDFAYSTDAYGSDENFW